jgi:NhaA family Na+:H+ antiporter
MTSPGTPAPPGTARRIARRILDPVEAFLSIEASSGIVLLGCALLALAWANSPARELYHQLWHTPLGPAFFRRDLHFWIDDGLMAVFFLVVGLEIRRETHAGVLSELRRAALPVLAAAGGMLVPALVFLALNAGGAAARAWGVPVATDIAFAVGVLSLLGRRVPPALRVLLLTLAVADDVGAIVVIALFYSSRLAPIGLLVAAGGVGLVLLMRSRVRHPVAYLLPALVIWGGAIAGGVHPALAGVVLGLLTPARPLPGESESPVERLLRQLHRPVAFAIMPLFALANAGVSLGSASFTGAGRAAFAGVALGLVVGKPVGVLAVSWLATRLRLCALPPQMRWREVLVLGMVAGIGFTMSLFVAGLAIADPPLLETVKLSVLCGSALSAALGLAAGRFLLRG